MQPEITFLLVFTEGQNSEPAFINSLVRYLQSQQPTGARSSIEVIPMPLDGNQGYSVSRIGGIITEHSNEYKAEWNDFDDQIAISKVLVCDYDNMEKYGIDERAFREQMLEYVS